jgi:hypothetical protein
MPILTYNKRCKDEFDGLFCSPECATECAPDQVQVPTFIETLEDESQDDLWYDTDDDCRMPMFGHCCHNDCCNKQIFE